MDNFDSKYGHAGEWPFVEDYTYRIERVATAPKPYCLLACFSILLTHSLQNSRSSIASAASETNCAADQERTHLRMAAWFPLFSARYSPRHLHAAVCLVLALCNETSSSVCCVASLRLVSTDRTPTASFAGAKTIQYWPSSSALRSEPTGLGVCFLSLRVHHFT